MNHPVYKTAWFRFYEELNDFLPKDKKKTHILYSFQGSPAVKFAIEALGVPHTEVDLILVNGVSVDFSHRLNPGDSVSVYPVFESIDITPITHLRERPLRDLTFIGDVHLGRLVKYLRLCGFDTHFRIDLDDHEIIELAESENRVILTRDKELLKNRKVTRGYYIRSEKPEEQLQEVILRFDLRGKIQAFTRCIVCNMRMIGVEKKDIITRLQPMTREYYNEFYMCSGCGRIYWKGGHWEKMKRFLIEKLGFDY
jgi:uncharacterized protein with PIN domain